MSSRLRVIVAIGALVSIPSGAALAARFPVGAVGPKITIYSGSNAAGRVRFKLVTPQNDSGKPTGPSVVSGFNFANKCSKRGTTVNASITVGPKHRFAYQHGGISISGVLLGPGLSQASGSTRAHTSACDSGVLRFRAASPAAPAAPTFTG